MDAKPFDTAGAKPLGKRLPGSGRPEFGQGSASALSMKWSALHDAAATVSTIAALQVEKMTPEIRNFPAVIRDVGGDRRARAEEGIEDLSAIMEPGVAALLAAYARGANPRAAAVALTQEFAAARNAIMALAPAKDAVRSMRFT
ncbi:MAG: hypothetical protein R3D89_13745 [Sphingomonadaceae bacterium]